ncbi:hypothetical protein LPW11_06125 [Geomonas sp. RF6]|uniref:hypothetical protein n=1 Tax=Geomonas sp. RF6 TaxID=2897342 RepID=UPI001E5B3D47|nr:hypothetical protein [Geomonas sp. RF6]UFS71767.1 hypothetical protein LPW11_06125 [Geomonas sp. RF6]
MIELLHEKIKYLELKVADAESQSPDILIERLRKRVEIGNEEIHRLREDGEDYKGQLTEKEWQLQELVAKLNKITSLLETYELVCPKCKAPLLRREYHTIYGYVSGSEVEADVEYVEYECGFATKEGEDKPLSPCGRSTMEEAGKGPTG